MEVSNDEKHGLEDTSQGKKRKRSKGTPILCGGTILYYDCSSPRPYLPPIRKDKMVCLAELAIRLYNINQLTNFAQVKVLKADVTYLGIVYSITFEAFSPLGLASVFMTKVRQFVGAYPNYEILFVKIIQSQQHLPGNIYEQQPLSQLIKTLSAGYLAPCLSQLALVMYNIFTLRVNKDALHDISSLKVVKAMKHVAEGTTYLVTFEASLRDKSKNVETFETQICLSTLFPTTTIEFNKVEIKHD